MARTGTVIYAQYSNWGYDSTYGRLERHDIKIQLPDGQVVEGKYDSKKIDQQNFVVGQSVDFDVEVKQTKGGDKYNKFKTVRKDFNKSGGYKEDPKVTAQIQRSSCLKRIVQIHEGFKVTNPTAVVEPAKMVQLLNHWVVAIGKDKQSSINAMAALESACSMIVIKNITNEDHLLEYAKQLFDYIQGNE